MSSELYDNSIWNKLDLVFPNVVSAPPDVAFRESSVDGKVKLPLISVHRVGMEYNKELFNHYESFVGRKLQYRPETKELARAKTLPILLRYQIDIWAQRRKFADGILREVLFFIQENPYLQITATDQDPTYFTLHLESFEDSTEITSYPEMGKIYRNIITYLVPTGKFFLYSVDKYVEEIPVEFFPLRGFESIEEVIKDKAAQEDSEEESSEGEG